MRSGASAPRSLARVEKRTNVITEAPGMSPRRLASSGGCALAGLLCAAQRPLCPLEQRDAVVVRLQLGYPGREAWREAEGWGRRRSDPWTRANVASASIRPDVGQHDGELVAARPEGQIARPERLPQECCDLDR